MNLYYAMRDGLAVQGVIAESAEDGAAIVNRKLGTKFVAKDMKYVCKEGGNENRRPSEEQD